jgi:uncharacterized protein YjiS (DUF1127 family)
VFASAGRALWRLGHKVAECRRQRRAYEELVAMSDHELEDIGVSRSEIDAIFAGKYQGAKPEISNVIVLENCRYRERSISRRRCHDERR